MIELKEFLSRAWQDYIALTPQALAIQEGLEEQQECIVNDHIAFRTFDFPGINIAAIEPELNALGYHPFDEYCFRDKHLSARAYFIDDMHPKIFLSELHIKQLSPDFCTLIETLLTSANLRCNSADFLISGRPWPTIPFNQYIELAKESEYAAWLIALGYHANHFTISLNHLQYLHDWPDFLDFLNTLDISLNMEGGTIKGSSDVLLEQASTLADESLCEFADGQHTVKTCFYEFAKRYPEGNGELFHGFVTANANKIFSSTNRDQ